MVETHQEVVAKVDIVLAPAEKVPDAVSRPFESMISADGLFVVDQDQRVVSWSESAERVVGIPASKAVGRRCYDLLGQFQQHNKPTCRRDCRAVSNARRGRTTPDFDVRLERDGCAEWLNVSILLNRPEGLRSRYLVHLLRDVTDRRGVEHLTREAAAESAVPEGESGLSRREQQCLQLLASGYNVPSIARSLGLSAITVRNHTHRAMAKLGAHTKLEAVVTAARRGLI
jgi:PAS domain S-box-containing protein